MQPGVLIVKRRKTPLERLGPPLTAALPAHGERSPLVATAAAIAFSEPSTFSLTRRRQRNLGAHHALRRPTKPWTDGPQTVNDRSAPQTQLVCVARNKRIRERCLKRGPWSEESAHSTQ